MDMSGGRDAVAEAALAAVGRMLLACDNEEIGSEDEVVWVSVRRGERDGSYDLALECQSVSAGMAAKWTAAAVVDVTITGAVPA